MGREITWRGCVQGFVRWPHSSKGVRRDHGTAVEVRQRPNQPGLCWELKSHHHPLESVEVQVYRNRLTQCYTPKFHWEDNGESYVVWGCW
jgi:hypothetical protein